MSITPSPEVLRMQRDDGTMYRSATVTVAPKDDATETRAISLAISSELPVLRYDWRNGGYYYEVLRHDASAVDLSRAQNGLPLLLGHDQDDVVGRAMGITVDADGVLRASDTKFSRSDAGRNAMMDVEDGILTDTSVGYVVGATYEEVKAETDEYPTRTYTSWTPFEVSLVAVPADPTVGVGRSATPAPVLSIQVADKSQERTMSVNTEAPAAESRADFILNACAAAGVGAEKARELLASDKDHSAITRELMAVVDARHASKPSQVVDFTEKEERQYSVVSAMNALVNGKRSGFEFEVSDEIAKRMGKSTTGFYMPTSLGKRTLLSVGNKANTKGGESVYTEEGGFIDLLRNRMVTAQAGVRMISGLQGDMSFVNQSASGTATWTNETTNASLSSASTGVRAIMPRTLQSATSYTRQLLAQSSIDVENMVREDIAAVHALAIDLAVLAGTGASNQPRGIINTVGIGAVTAGANGAQPTYAEVVGLQREVAIDNAFAGSLAYIVHPLIASRLMLTQQFASTNGVPLWTGNILDGQLGGLRAFASTQVPTAQTVGTSTDCSPMIFGDFSAAGVYEWGAMELLVDPYTLGPTQVKVMSLQMVDIFIRYAEKFSVFAGARI
jgi:HK97 family phage major capsid protein/HK97 family phage prohead protease